jgi:tetratricopeptide (TPR) repeat protein
MVDRPMRRSAIVLSFFVACAAGGVSRAGAEPPAETGPPAAKKHFEAAKAAYKAGAYREAVGELERAIELDPNGKDLHFNLGLVHEKLGEIDRAIAAFKRYTELETDTGELERTIATIRRLEGARDELAKRREDEVKAGADDGAKAPPDVAPPAVAPVSDRRKKGKLDGWVWATGGLSVAALGVGTYFGVQALSTRRSTEDATGKGLSVYQLEDRAAKAHDQAVIADVAFAVGVASAGAAALLYFTRDARPGAPRVGALLAPGASFVQVEAGF